MDPEEVKEEEEANQRFTERKFVIRISSTGVTKEVFDLKWGQDHGVVALDNFGECLILYRSQDIQIVEKSVQTIKVTIVGKLFPCETDSGRVLCYTRGMSYLF